MAVNAVQINDPPKYQPGTLNYKTLVLMPYWSLFEAINYISNFEVQASETWQTEEEYLRKGQIQFDLYLDLVKKLVFSKKLKPWGDCLYFDEHDQIESLDLNEATISPKQFIEVLHNQNVSLPKEFQHIINVPSKPDSNLTQKEEKEQSPRNSQRRKERCRALAEYIWGKNPNTTIADMAVSDAITVYGCESHNYAEDTIRDWIKDLCPNRDPGRRTAKEGSLTK